MRAVVLSALASILALAAAQTLTVPDAAGETVVEVVTVDINGLPSTTIIQTLDAGAGVGDVGLATTVTTLDPVLEETVIAVISTDADGDVLTQTLSILPPDVATTSTTTPAVPADPTTAPVVVGQSPTDVPAGATVYTYTTTDDTGATVAVEDTFTPTFSSFTNSPVKSITGTILPYSAWTAAVGTNTIASKSGAAGLPAADALRRWAVAVGALATAMAGGAWAVLL